MAARRSAVRNWLEYALVRAALSTLAIAPPKLSVTLARWYAAALDRFAPRLRRVALDNLRHALPHLDAAQRGAMVDEVFASIARIFTSFAKFPSINQGNVGEWIRCEGLQHVEAALARGRGAIFATGHLGNWELSAYAFALLYRPIGIVVRPLDNPLIDAFVDRYRGLSGNTTLSKRDSIRGILRALARNEMTGILADQHVQDGVAIQFFGRPALTATGIAKIAARAGAAVIPGFAMWMPAEGKYVLRFLPEVPITGDAVADTAAIQSALESVIREFPGQWLWIHRRWKT